MYRTSDGWTLITGPDDIPEALETLHRHHELALDTETFAIPEHAHLSFGPAGAQNKRFTDPYLNRVRLVQLAGTGTDAYVFDLSRLGSGREALRQFLSRNDVTWVGHNLKFDYKMLKTTLDVRLERVWDTQIASELIGHATGTSFGRRRGHTLKSVLRDFLGISVSKAEQAGYWGGDLTQEQISYSATDVKHLLALKHKLAGVLTGPYPYGFDMGPVTDLEMRLVPTLARLELRGMGLDPDMLGRVRECARYNLPDLVGKLCQAFGIPRRMGLLETTPDLNLDSPIQLKKLLADNGIEVEDTQEETLEEYAKIYPKLADLLEYRHLQKALSFDYGSYIHPLTRRAHPNFRQLGAGTSRMSSNNFNVQQVPKLLLPVPDKLQQVGDDRFRDKKDGKIYLSYRHAFVPADQQDLIGGDYSGQELCIMAVASGDPTMIHILGQPELLPDGSKNPDADLHSQAGAEMFGLSVADVMNGAKNQYGRKARDDAKIINFAMPYGKTEESFVKEWGEAARIIFANHRRKFPRLHEFLDRKAREGRETRMSRFPEGHPLARLRFLNDSDKADRGAVERLAKNTPIQGAGATMIKLAMITLDEHPRFRDDGAGLVCQIHDEILSEDLQTRSTETRQIIKTTMEQVGNQFLGGLARSDVKAGSWWPK